MYIYIYNYSAVLDLHFVEQKRSTGSSCETLRVKKEKEISITIDLLYIVHTRLFFYTYIQYIVMYTIHYRFNSVSECRVYLS